MITDWKIQNPAAIVIKQIMEGKKVCLVSRSEFKRNIENLSKRTGIYESEIREIIEPIIRRKMDEMLAR